MSDHNDPKPTHTSASGKDAAAHDDDFLDSTIDSDDPYESRDQTFGQDNSYDPLSDDLFAQGNTVMFNDEEKQAKRSKWMIIGGVVLVAVALILALKLLAGGSDEPQITTPPAPVKTQPAAAPAADSDELVLLPTEIAVPMPTTQQQAEEQIDALGGEQELLDEQMAMYEDQLATSQKLTELKAAQIAALEKQLSEQSTAAGSSGSSDTKSANAPVAKTAEEADQSSADPAQSSAQAPDSAVKQP